MMSWSRRHSCFISSHSARAASGSPRSRASIARSMVGRDIWASSSRENHRSLTSRPPPRRLARSDTAHRGCQTLAMLYLGPLAEVSSETELVVLGVLVAVAALFVVAEFTDVP